MVLLASLATLLMGLPISDAIKQDLNSPIYAIREKACAQLRSSYVSTVPDRHDELQKSLHLVKGETFEEVAASCQKAAIPFPGQDTRPSFNISYALDPCVTVTWVFSNRILIDFAIVSAPPVIPNTPPTNYTGLWRTYRENGEKVSEIYYSNGRRLGPLSDGGGASIPRIRNENIEIKVENVSPPPK